MPKDFASASCNKNRILQKIIANNGKQQRHFALRKNKMYVVRTNFTKQENCFCPSLRITPRKTAFCKNLLQITENYNGILLCGKTKCTLSAQNSQNKNLLFTVFEDYATENCLVQKITATTKNYNGILLCGKANCTLSAQNSQNKNLLLLFLSVYQEKMFSPDKKLKAMPFSPQSSLLHACFG